MGGAIEVFSSDPEARMFVSLLGLGDVYRDVVLAGVFADHLAFVHLFHRRDEEASAVLQFVDRVGVGRTRFARDDRAVDPHFDFARPRFESFQAMCHDRFAGRCREHIGSQTDDTARGNRKFEPRTVAVGFHVGQGPLAFGGQFDHCPRVLLGTIDGHLFDRFALLAVDLLDDDLGLSYLEFVTFATHGFDQHREVQHAPSEYDETVGVGSRFDAQGEVFLQARGRGAP